MSGQMKDGDEVRLIGSGGAPLFLTVGLPFSAEEIEKRLNSREWRREGEEAPEPDGGPQPRTEKLSKPQDGEPGGPTPRREFLSKPGERPDQELTGEAVGSDRPADSAPKAEWVAYVARTRHMSREDASNYTKADLIEMAS